MNSYLLINLLKFIHILLSVSLLGFVTYSVSAIVLKNINLNVSQHENPNRIDNILLLIAILVMLTGSLLVKPNHFSFHTAWVEAAYFFMLTFVGIILLLMIGLKKKQNIKNERWIRLFAYSVMFIILICIIHDAVTKTTFLFTLVR